MSAVPGGHNRSTACCRCANLGKWAEVRFSWGCAPPVLDVPGLSVPGREVVSEQRVVDAKYLRPVADRDHYNVVDQHVVHLNEELTPPPGIHLAGRLLVQPVIGRVAPALQIAAH